MRRGARYLRLSFFFFRRTIKVDPGVVPPYLRGRRGAPLCVAAGLPRAYGLPPFPNPTDRGAESLSVSVASLPVCGKGHGDAQPPGNCALRRVALASWDEEPAELHRSHPAGAPYRGERVCAGY